MTDKRRTAVRLSSEYIDRLDIMASAIGCPRATIIHNAIVAYLEVPTRASASISRLAQTTEYMQIVDLIVSRDMPEKRDAILATVAQRLEQFHGGL